jgi:biotin synthase-related radical SAM superfamily protein
VGTNLTANDTNVNPKIALITAGCRHVASDHPWPKIAISWLKKVATIACKRHTASH